MSCEFCEDEGCDMCTGGDDSGACAWCESEPCTCDPDEDGGGDGFGDFDEEDEVPDGLPPLMRQLSYEFVDHEKINLRQKKLIVVCSEELAISMDEAGCMLRAYLWNLDKAKRDWYDDPDATRKKVGVAPPIDLSKAPELIQCSSAMCDQVASSEAYALGCDHWFCLDCWKGFLEVQVGQGPDCIYTTCPGYTCSKKKNCKHRNEDNCKCNNLIPEAFFFSMLNPSLQKKYEKFMRDSFVDQAKAIRWCPKATCTMAVSSTNDNLVKTVYCKCGHSFCFKCGLPAHAPVPCDLASKFVSLESTDALTEALIKATTKPCPKCKTLIEKNEACLHMTCRSCRFGFCWLCKGEWKNHQGSYYSCAIYNQKKEKGVVTEEEKTRTENVHTLRKYNFFRDQYSTHEKTRGKVRERLALVEAQTEEDASKVKFLEDCLKELMRAYNFLQWSYCLSYFCKASKEKWLFVEQQRILEERTGKLWEFIDKKSQKMNLENDARQFIVNNAAVVKKAVDINLVEMENGQLIEVIQNEPDQNSDEWACLKCNKPVPPGDDKVCACGACFLHGERQCWGCKPQGR